MSCRTENRCCGISAQSVPRTSPTVLGENGILRCVTGASQQTTQTTKRETGGPTTRMKLGDSGDAYRCCASKSQAESGWPTMPYNAKRIVAKLGLAKSRAGTDGAEGKGIIIA